MGHEGGLSGGSSGRIQLLLALALLGVLIAFAALPSTPSVATPFDPRSAAPTGLRALWLWLEAMEFRVERNDGAAFAIPDDCTLFLVFPNQHLYSNAEAKQLQSWVKAGGTLALIGATALDQALIKTFLVEPGPAIGELLVDVDQTQPLLPDLSAPIRLSGDTETLDLSQAPAAIPVLATADGQITLALQPLGRGRIWHFSLHHSLVNEQLRDPAQATLVPAILRHVVPGGRIVFDTYHLLGPAATATEEIRSLQDWLYGTPLGWAVFFGLVATLLFLVLQGQRLGPPLPTTEELRRREAAEYVMAMANLLRRGQQRAFIAAHHKQRLKRALGRSLNVSPDLDDTAFLRQLQHDHTLSPEDEQQLTNLLRALEATGKEQDLPQTVREVDALLERTGKRRGSR